MVERQVRGRSLLELASALEDSAGTVFERIAAASDTPAHRDGANHVIGIERWGQGRLRHTLIDRQAPQLDGHRPYRPSDDTPIAELADAFAECRRATVALAREIAAAGIDPGTSVPHNDLGELSVAGWLTYLDGHGLRESRFRLRG